MMTGWFRRARQTRSTVTNREEAHRQQRLAACAAYRMLGAIGLIAQLMLWVTLYAYDRLVQTTWQAALLLALPLAGLWALWRRGEVALATQKGARCTLLLLPCLVLDAAVLIRTLAGYISQLIPEYPYWACALVPAVLCWLTALLSRENGAAYGASLFRLLLPGLFLLATVFLNTNAIRCACGRCWDKGRHAPRRRRWPARGAAGVLRFCLCCRCIPGGTIPHGLPGRERPGARRCGRRCRG